MPRWRLWSDFSPRARLAIACGTLIILFCMLFRRGVQDLGLAGRARLAAAWSLGASANRSQQGEYACAALFGAEMEGTSCAAPGLTL